MLLKLKYTLIITIVILLCHSSLFAQHHISVYEFRWAFFHPFAALRIKKQLPCAMAVYQDVHKAGLLDNYGSGGKLDAFRHTHTMAYLARRIPVKKLRKLGRAHEKGNRRQFLKGSLEDGERPDSLACEMDLRNNELGFQLGAANKTVADSVLKEIVLLAIKEGKAWYLKRNTLGQYVNCDHKPLDLRLYDKIWFVPKCLVKSDE